jgi:hypothetical protein
MQICILQDLPIGEPSPLSLRQLAHPFYLDRRLVLTMPFKFEAPFTICSLSS